MKSLYYKNTSHSQMTFYGVVFKPGDVKEVPGYINHPKFARVTKPETKNIKSQSESTSKSKEVKINQPEEGGK